MTKQIAALMLAGSIAACSPQPEAVAPAYISPTVYSGMSCSALNAEAQRINARLGQATAQQERAASNDAAATAVALVLFWPAAFFIGNKGDEANLARLKGEAEAVHAAAGQRGC